MIDSRKISNHTTSIQATTQSILRITSSEKQTKRGVSFLNYNEAEEYDRHLIGVKRRAQRKEQRKKTRKHKEIPMDRVFNAIGHPTNRDRLITLITNHQAFRNFLRLFLEHLELLGHITAPTRIGVAAVHEMFERFSEAIDNGLSYQTIAHDQFSNSYLRAIEAQPEFRDNTTYAVSEESDSDSISTTQELLNAPIADSSLGASSSGTIDSTIDPNVFDRRPPPEE